jgi:hypothetical protein
MRIGYWILIIIVILLVAVTILYKNYNESIVRGSSPNVRILEFDKDNLKECCNYYDGKLKTCSILKEYSCDLCNNKCS